MTVSSQKYSGTGYVRVIEVECEEESEPAQLTQSWMSLGEERSRKISQPRCIFTLFALSFLCFCGLGISWMRGFKQDHSCKNPIQRREWRTLSADEKNGYVAAVQCLGNQHSRLGLNHSLYDDFVWVHSRMGNFCKL
jgi:hypothetical protein